MLEIEVMPSIIINRLSETLDNADDLLDDQMEAGAIDINDREVMEELRRVRKFISDLRWLIMVGRLK
ncbi:MAG: hypothetical protein IJI33_00030 [Solobacterium sp.]|nr:hypothetical protein [Solobacterium sp.]